MKKIIAAALVIGGYLMIQGLAAVEITDVAASVAEQHNQQIEEVIEGAE